MKAASTGAPIGILRLLAPDFVRHRCLNQNACGLPNGDLDRFNTGLEIEGSKVAGHENLFEIHTPFLILRQDRSGVRTEDGFYGAAFAAPA
jgi:hypothetical protein